VKIQKLGSDKTSVCNNISTCSISKEGDNMEDCFADFDELKDNIERGGEIESIYHGKHFSITHFEENGQHKVSVMQAYNDDSEKVYDIAESSNIGEYLLDGQKLENVISDCQITFRCF
jgi:hypothetical protein